MADQPQTVPAPTADANAPVFQIQRMYLKDMSLEIPHAPQIFLEQGQPQVGGTVGPTAAPHLQVGVVVVHHADA